MDIREAAPGDLPDILRLYRQLQPDDPVLTDGRDRDVFETILDSPWLTIFVLEQDGRIRSSCYLNVIPNITRQDRLRCTAERHDAATWLNPVLAD